MKLHFLLWVSSQQKFYLGSECKVETYTGYTEHLSYFVHLKRLSIVFFLV